MAHTILITGFAPFGGERTNPSWEVAKRFDGAEIGAATITAMRLPVHCARAARSVAEAIEETSPAACTAPALTLALSITCSLFVLLPQLVSFVFNSLRPLFRKHPGWGYPDCPYGTLGFGHPLFTTRYSPPTLL